MDNQTLDWPEYILENFPASVYWMDRNHIYQGCNLETCRVLGLNSPQEFIGRNVFDLAKMLNWPENRAQDIHDLDKKIMETKMKSETHDVMSKQYEKSISQAGLKQPIFDEKGEVIGLLAIGISNAELSNHPKIIRP